MGEMTEAARQLAMTVLVGRGNRDPRLFAVTARSIATAREEFDEALCTTGPVSTSVVLARLLVSGVVTEKQIKAAAK